jgi:hypothetical protein
MMLEMVILATLAGASVKPTCLADTAAPAILAVERIAEIVTRRDGEMVLKRRMLSLPHVVRSEIRIRTGSGECRKAIEAYRASLELMSNDPLADVVVVKIGQERYIVVAVDRMDSREPSWAVYDERWEEKILFRTP